MIKSLQRRLQKLDNDLGIGAFEASARLLCQRLKWNADAAMPILMRHQRQLAPRLGYGKWEGTVDPEGYGLVHSLVPPEVRTAPPTPPAPGESPEPETGRKKRAIQALVDFPDRYQAAEAAGISRVTLWRWMQQPSFLLALADARRFVYYHAFSTVQQSLPEAIEAAHAIVDDANASAPTRLRAVRTLVTLGQMNLDQSALEAHIARMEEALHLGPDPEAPPPCNAEPPDLDPEPPVTPSPTNQSPSPSSPPEIPKPVPNRSTSLSPPAAPSPDRRRQP